MTQETPGRLAVPATRRGAVAAVVVLVLVAGLSILFLRGPSCSPAFGSFGGGVHPPGCWRPYSDTSPVNRRIGAHPRLAPRSAAIVGRLLSFGRPENLLAGTGGRRDFDSGRPLYYSRTGDPRFQLHCTEPWGVCPLEGARIQIPDGARPAGGSDAHLTVIDQHSGWEYDLWHVSSKPPGGGRLVFGWGGKTRIHGNGLGSAAVAAGYGTAAGLLRAEELGSGSINHALFLVVKCDSGQHVYPAAGQGRACASLGLSNADAPAEGTRFQLAMSDEEISSLSVPAWKKTLFTAMAHYGLIVGDTGGHWGIAQESGNSYTSLGQPDRWVAIAKALGAPYYAPDQDYVFDLNDGADWARHLRVLDPCVSRGAC